MYFLRQRPEFQEKFGEQAAAEQPPPRRDGG